MNPSPWLPVHTDFAKPEYRPATPYFPFIPAAIKISGNPPPSPNGGKCGVPSKKKKTSVNGPKYHQG